MHDHYYLSDIFTHFWTHICDRGSFVDLVFRLVMFHQSLPGVNAFPALVLLTKEERLIYCDEHLYRLMRILMINDSCSYLYVYNPDKNMETNNEEFKANSIFLIEEWREKVPLLFKAHADNIEKK